MHVCKVSLLCGILPGFYHAFPPQEYGGGIAAGANHQSCVFRFTFILFRGLFQLCLSGHGVAGCMIAESSIDALVVVVGGVSPVTLSARQVRGEFISLTAWEMSW